MTQAWICQLACGRWIVVTRDTEMRRGLYYGYYGEVIHYRSTWNANLSAYKRNEHAGFKGTVFPDGCVPGSLFK